MVGSSELLLDDSVRYAARARNVTLEVWHDMPHVCPLFPIRVAMVDYARPQYASTLF